MKSLFDSKNLNEIIERVNKLTPDAKAEWGKMNVSQMLAHVSQSLRTASGELKLKRALIGVLFGGIVKRMALVDDKPFGKNSPTDKTFIITDERNFADEKAKLISLVENFSKSGSQGVTKETHPFFGKMNPEQWDILMMKHLDHHLRQFGA